jgi:hypothetical protein
MTWHFDQGPYAGLTTVAVVLGESNLAENGARRSLLYIDGQADETTRNALVSQLRTRYQDALGQIIRVQSETIRFEDDGRELSLRVGEKALVAQLDVSRLTCDHCPMPHEVWYAPLTPVERIVVGMARENHYANPQMKINWTRTQENSAFIGKFKW